MFEQSGADERHRDRPFAALAQHGGWAAAFAAACKIVDAGGILVLLGDRGNGKTQLGVELIRRSCSNLRQARYYRSREIGMTLRQAYNRGNTLTEEDAVKIFTDPPLLVVDECQERSDNDWEIRSFNLIVDKRYGRKLATVLIANCTSKQFARLMGAGIVDRIKESGGKIVLDWPSFRGTT